MRVQYAAQGPNEMSKPKQYALLVILVSGLMQATNAAAIEFYTGIKPLLYQAIENGQSKGELGGPWAGLFQRRFETQEPLYAKVTTLKRYQEPGCSKLNIQYSIAKAKTQAGERKKAIFDQQVNMCLDGNPPKEAIDIEKTYEFFNSRAKQSIITR